MLTLVRQWARTSVEELHLIRMAVSPELPRFVGTVDRQLLRLSEKMSPAEAVFVVMTLGRGMVLMLDEFRDGPEAYVARIRERQLSPPRSGAELHIVVAGSALDLSNGDGFNDQHSPAATSAQRFLDQLGFPR